MHTKDSWEHSQPPTPITPDPKPHYTSPIAPPQPALHPPLPPPVPPFQQVTTRLVPSFSSCTPPNTHSPERDGAPVPRPTVRNAMVQGTKTYCPRRDGATALRLTVRYVMKTTNFAPENIDFRTRKSAKYRVSSSRS